MNIFTKILSVLVALEFLYIFYLETIATTSDKTSNVFGMTKDELGQKNVNVLFKNQGVYNGLLSVLILLAVFVFASKAAVICLMAYIVAVALYGSFTSNPKIILMQGPHPDLLHLLTCTGTYPGVGRRGGRVKTGGAFDLCGDDLFRGTVSEVFCGFRSGVRHP